MFIELVDSLRCIASHEDTWLVAAVTRMDGRHIVEGKLGCPVCRREYPIRAGVAWFSTAPPDTAAAAGLTHAISTTDADRLTRAAALLGLEQTGGIVVLGASWVDCADALAEVGAAHVVVLNTEPSESSPQEVSAIVVDERLPFGSGSLRGVALGQDLATVPLLASSRDALRSGGRLVAPANAGVPEGVRVLARDDVDWVGERAVVASPPVALRSARR